MYPQWLKVPARADAGPFATSWTGSSSMAVKPIARRYGAMRAAPLYVPASEGDTSRTRSNPGTPASKLVSLDEDGCAVRFRTCASQMTASSPGIAGRAPVRVVSCTTTPLGAQRPVSKLRRGAPRHSPPPVP